MRSMTYLTCALVLCVLFGSVRANVGDLLKARPRAKLVAVIDGFGRATIASQCAPVDDLIYDICLQTGRAEKCRYNR